jgi:hypothetical protein
MTVARIARKRKKIRGSWFRGISGTAHALGVSRSHLWRVLTGERRSLSLMARYRALPAARVKSTLPGSQISPAQINQRAATESKRHHHKT